MRCCNCICNASINGLSPPTIKCKQEMMSIEDGDHHLQQQNTLHHCVLGNVIIYLLIHYLDRGEQTRVSILICGGTLRRTNSVLDLIALHHVLLIFTPTTIMQIITANWSSRHNFFDVLKWNCICLEGVRCLDEMLCHDNNLCEKLDIIVLKSS